MDEFTIPVKKARDLLDLRVIFSFFLLVFRYGWIFNYSSLVHLIKFPENETNPAKLQIHAIQPKDGNLIYRKRSDRLKSMLLFT